MSSDIQVIQATPGDLPVLEGLIGELFEAMVEPPAGGLRDAVANCRALVADPTHGVLVARIGGVVVGMLNFTTRRTIAHARPSALIDELVVSRSHRGRGVGSRLVEEAADRARALGCEELEVSTESSNSKARAFYINCGFDEESVLLERQLGETGEPRQGR
jgi:GNAT superfamily N-acetyltransferase